MIRFVMNYRSAFALIFSVLLSCGVLHIYSTEATPDTVVDKPAAYIISFLERTTLSIHTMIFYADSDKSSNIPGIVCLSTESLKERGHEVLDEQDCKGKMERPVHAVAWYRKSSKVFSSIEYMKEVLHRGLLGGYMLNELVISEQEMRNSNGQKIIQDYLQSTTEHWKEAAVLCIQKLINGSQELESINPGNAQEVRKVADILQVTLEKLPTMIRLESIST